MKKLFLLLAFVPTLIIGQISASKIEPSKELGKVKRGGLWAADISYKIIGSDTLYTLAFQNSEYTHVTDIKYIRFSSKDNTLNKFYEYMNSVFEESKKDKDYTLKVQIGDQSVLIYGDKYATKIIANGGSTWFNPRQLKALFGK